jgi:hypothetical protein
MRTQRDLKDTPSAYFGADKHPGVREGRNDSGSAARFFYMAKSSRADRSEGLDGTCTVKYIIDSSTIGELSCKDVSTALVESLQRVMSEDGLEMKWLTADSGESIMGLCPSGSLSIIATAINRITESRILNSLPPSITNEFTPVVNSARENGGNPVESAERSSPSEPNTTPASQAVSVLGARRVVSQMLSAISAAENWKPLTNFHATVKPTSLMRYLCRLVTPPHGTILDPFMGSGSTGKAAMLEGFQFIGIELNAEYIEIARARIDHVKHNTQQSLLAL